MKQVAMSIWKRGIVSTFLAGLFVILPIAITVAIMVWVGRKIYDLMGPESWLGEGLAAVGLQFGEHGETVAMLIGWAIVLASIWFLGVLVKSMTKGKVEKLLHRTITQIPLIEKIYNPVSQVVGMIKGDDKSDMKAMDVVYADFGDGPGFLGLLAGNQTYRFVDQECHIVYIPTSPVPMSGGIIFVPVARVHNVDMTIDDLMQIYFSLGVMSSKVVSDKYIRPATEGA